MAIAQTPTSTVTGSPCASPDLQRSAVAQVLEALLPGESLRSQEWLGWLIAWTPALSSYQSWQQDLEVLTQLSKEVVMLCEQQSWQTMAWWTGFVSAVPDLSFTKNDWKMQM